jgi:hypothetical protein
MLRARVKFSTIRDIASKAIFIVIEEADIDWEQRETLESCIIRIVAISITVHKSKDRSVRAAN